MADGNGRDSAATSSPVSTPTTPGTARAAATSTAMIRAWASVERTTAASAIWGKGFEVVHEPALSPEEGVVLDPLDRARGHRPGIESRLGHFDRAGHPRVEQAEVGVLPGLGEGQSEGVGL